MVECGHFGRIMDSDWLIAGVWAKPSNFSKTGREKVKLDVRKLKYAIDKDVVAMGVWMMEYFD